MTIKNPLLADSEAPQDRRISSSSATQNNDAKPTETAAVLEGKALVRHLIAVVPYYAACSSFMLIFNKLAASAVAAPCFLCFLQAAFTGVAVKLCQMLKLIESEPYSFREMLYYMPIAAGFLASLYIAFNILAQTSVETFIFIRSSTPLLLSVLDYVFLGRELPSTAALASLLGLLIGTAGFGYLEAEGVLGAAPWLVVWYIQFIAYEVYAKHIVDTVKMTAWDRVFVTNMLPVVPFIIMSLFLGEFPTIIQTKYTLQGITNICFACLCAVGISHSAYVVRVSISNTAFNVIGILCKLVTLLATQIIFKKHSGVMASLCLTLSIIAGSSYRQAPLREKATKASDGEVVAQQTTR